MGNQPPSLDSNLAPNRSPFPFVALTEPKPARQAHLRRSWPFHGGELLRLVGMLVEWKAAGAVGGDPREVSESLSRCC